MKLLYVDIEELALLVFCPGCAAWWAEWLSAALSPFIVIIWLEMGHYFLNKVEVIGFASPRIGKVLKFRGLAKPITSTLFWK